MSEDICIDNRFELVDKYQKILIDRTNITDSPDEMKALYSILYRCWQMGWLDRLDTIADMQAENAMLRNGLDFCLKYAPNCDECAAMLDCDECLRADASQKERKRVDYENDKLRELVEDMAAEIRGLGVDFKRVGWCDYADRMHELGIKINE